MTKAQIIRKQKPIQTDIEKLFKIAVDELMKVWDNKSNHNVEKLHGIVKHLRSKKQFPEAVYNTLESYFKKNGKFYIESAGMLISDSSKEMFELLSILDPEAEVKILREAWECFHDFGTALTKMVLNPAAVFDDAYTACSFGVLPNQQTIRSVKQLWNKEVAKANGQQPGIELQTKYAFVVRCMYCKASNTKVPEIYKKVNKRYASELYRMNGFNRQLISHKEMCIYKQALQKHK